MMIGGSAELQQILNSSPWKDFSSIVIYDGKLLVGTFSKNERCLEVNMKQSSNAESASG
jgi:hypothetical protein